LHGVEHVVVGGESGLVRFIVGELNTVTLGVATIAVASGGNDVD